MGEIPAGGIGNSWRKSAHVTKYWSGDGLVVCFDELTGDTHVINEFAAQLLDSMPLEPVSLADLYDSNPELSVPDEEKRRFLNKLENILLDLSEYGLVEQD